MREICERVHTNIKTVMHRIEECADVEASQQRSSAVEMSMCSNTDDISILHTMTLQP